VKIHNRSGRELTAIDVLPQGMGEPLPWFLIPPPDGRLFRLIAGDYFERPTLEGDSPDNPSRWVWLEVDAGRVRARHRRRPGSDSFEWETKDGNSISDSGRWDVRGWEDDGGL